MTHPAIIGNATLYLGDGLELLLLIRKQVDAVVSDPPYGKRRFFTMPFTFKSSMPITEFERSPQIFNGLLGHCFADFAHPRELFVLHRVELLAQLRSASPRFVLPLPFGKRPIVGESCDPAGLGKERRLPVVRVKPIL